MKIRIVPVAAGLAAATGLAISGTYLANAEATTSAGVANASVATCGEGQQPPSQPPEGGSTATEPPHGNGSTDPSKPMRDDGELLTGEWQPG